MDALWGPVAVACALLVLAGVAKVVRPVPTAGALLALRLPGPLLGVRVLGAGEIVLGLAALVWGATAPVALVAAAYVAFAVVVVAAMRAGTDIQSCGCFGTVDTPPSLVHVVVNLGLAAAAAAAAVTGLSTLPSFLSDQPWAGVPFVGLVAVTLYLVYLAIAVLPLTLAAGAAR